MVFGFRDRCFKCPTTRSEAAERAERTARKEGGGRSHEGGPRSEGAPKAGAEGYSGYPAAYQGYYQAAGWDYQAYYAYHAASASGFRDYAVEKPDAYRAFLQYVRSGQEGTEVVLADRMCLDRHVVDLMMCLESWLWRESGPPAVSGQPWRLAKLNLARNDLSDESVVQIAQRLKQLDIRVRRLDLDSNMAAAKGLAALTEYVWNCQDPLAEIGLACNAIEVGAETEGDDPVSGLLRCLYNHPAYPAKAVESTSDGDDVQVSPLTIRLAGNRISNGEKLLDHIREKGGAKHVRVCGSAAVFQGNGEEFLAVHLPNLADQGSAGRAASQRDDGFLWAPAAAIEDGEVDEARRRPGADAAAPAEGGAEEPEEPARAARATAKDRAQAPAAAPAPAKAAKKAEDGAPKKRVVKKATEGAAADGKAADPAKEGKRKVKRKTSAASTPKASPVLTPAAAPAAGAAAAPARTAARRPPAPARPPPPAVPAAGEKKKAVAAGGKAAADKAADGKAAPARKKVKRKVKKVKPAAEGAEPGAAAKPAATKAAQDAAPRRGATSATQAAAPQDDLEVDSFGGHLGDALTAEEKATLERDVSGCLGQTPGLDPRDKETRAELSEFVVTMLIARKKPSEVHRELEGFLKDETSGFVSWLIDHLKGPWLRAHRAKAGATPKAAAGRMLAAALPKSAD